MKLSVKLPTFKVEKRHKPDPSQLVRSVMIFSYGPYHSGYTTFDGKFVMGLVYEKHRKKVTRKRKGRDTISKVVKQPKWVCYYTWIPVDLLKSSGLKLIQKSRHFVITTI